MRPCRSHRVGIHTSDRVREDTGLAPCSKANQGAGRYDGVGTTTRPQARISLRCVLRIAFRSFGEVANGKMEASRLGTVIEDCWAKLPDHYDNVALDAFILMPNHVHGVIIIEDGPTCVGAGLKPALPAAVSVRRHGVSEIVRAFKTFSAREINEMRASTGTPVWQRGFYDHVIRDNGELDRVRTYVMDNPRKWSEDADNPANWGGRGRVSNPPLRTTI